jgi:hypothetical protein
MLQMTPEERDNRRRGKREQGYVSIHEVDVEQLLNRVRD